MKCNSCGYINSKKSAFCEKCGVKLEKQDTICADCHKSNPAHFKFCASCGSNLVEQKTRLQRRPASVNVERGTDAEREPAVIEKDYDNIMGRNDEQRLKGAQDPGHFTAQPLKAELQGIKKESKVRIFIIIIAAIAIAGIAIFFLMNTGKDNEAAEPEQKITSAYTEQQVAADKTKGEGATETEDEGVTEAEYETVKSENSLTWAWNYNYPAFPSGSVKDVYIIYSTDSGNIEMAAFNLAKGVEDEVYFLWDGYLTINNSNWVRDCDYYLLDNYSWREIETNYTMLSDEVYDIAASNINIYDQQNTLILAENDFSKQLTLPIIDEEEEGIHRYSYIIADCGWNEAFERAQSMGGYLAHINSEEEFDYIVSEIESLDYSNIQFYIGGSRAADSSDYYWINEEKQPYGESLNAAMGSWFWMDGEPSYSDEGVEEMYLNILYYKAGERWVGNDVPENIVTSFAIFSGKIGYIIEYED